MHNQVTSRFAWTRMGLCVTTIVLSLVFLIPYKIHAAIQNQQDTTRQGAYCLANTQSCTVMQQFIPTQSYALKSFALKLGKQANSINITAKIVHVDTTTHKPDATLFTTSFLTDSLQDATVSPYAAWYTIILPSQIWLASGVTYGILLNSDTSYEAVNWPNWEQQTLTTQYAYYGTTDYTTWGQNGYSFAYRTYDNTDFTIQTPALNSIVNSAVSISGTCTTAVDLELYDNASFASSTQQYGISKLCSANTYSWYAGFLDTGYWYIHASSSGEHRYSSFYSQSYSTLPPPVIASTTPTTTLPFGLNQNPFQDWIAGWSCPDPFFSVDVCKQVGILVNGIVTPFASLGQQSAAWFSRARPFSYPFELWGDVQTQLSVATSTSSTMPSVSIQIPTSTNPNIAFQATIFDTNSMTKIIPQNQWNTMRPYFNIGLYLIFALYLWSIIGRLV